MDPVKYTDILDELQISNITKIVQGIFSQEIEFLNYSVKFGNFYGGLCLVYCDDSDVEYFTESNSEAWAVLAVNQKGELLSFYDKNVSFNGSEIHNFDKNKNKTLTKFRLKRITEVAPGFVSLQDLYKRFSIEDVLSPTELIIYDAEYCEGYVISGWVDFDYDDTDDEVKKIHMGGIAWVSNGTINRVIPYNVENFTHFLFNRKYLLTKYRYESLDWCDMEDFECFPRYMVKDCHETRYGVFDIQKGKTIIHCGEYKGDKGYINGFINIEFKGNNIYTYTSQDMFSGKGILYTPQRPVPNTWIMRVGVSPVSIIRCGPHAGRNIAWMKENKLQTLLDYLYESCIHISDLKTVVQHDSLAVKKQLWIANDKHLQFWPITSFDDYMCTTSDCEEMFPDSSFKHMGEDFLSIVYNDPSYLIAMIQNRNVSIYMDVFSELRKNTTDGRFLKNIKDVENAMSQIIEEDEQTERERWEESCDWEDDEFDGYRSAFEDDPDNEWNID